MPYSAEHKARSRERIIAAATELFCRHGFDKVSISQVMKQAQMTHGAFYNHFESKTALYEAVFLEPLKTGRSTRLVKGPLSMRHLLALATHYCNLSELGRKGRPGHEMILFNEIGNENAEIKKLFETSYRNLKQMVERRLTAMNRLRKLPRELDREALSDRASAILASLVGAVAIARNIPNEQERARILQGAQKQILTMLGVVETDLDGHSSS